jgi:predicted AAA+ superfamily ATPase
MRGHSRVAQGHDLSRDSSTPLIDQLLDRALRVFHVLDEVDWTRSHAAVWRQSRWQSGLVAHAGLDDVALEDLLHVEAQKTALVTNTRQFLAGLPANNVLLWGARGTGKSSLIHAVLLGHVQDGLRLVEVGKEDLCQLAEIVDELVGQPYKFIVFCDDLSFEADDPSYKALKSALEGSIFKSSANVLIYATSNRRHLLPEYMQDNQASGLVEGELHHGEAVEEKISLSDRFGLWLSFYPFKQEDYVDVVEHWIGKLADAHDLPFDFDDALRKEALSWALARGVRSGRTAQHFARHWVGRAKLETPVREKPTP